MGERRGGGAVPGAAGARRPSPGSRQQRRRRPPLRSLCIVHCWPRTTRHKDPFMPCPAAPASPAAQPMGRLGPLLGRERAACRLLSSRCAMRTARPRGSFPGWALCPPSCGPCPTRSVALEKAPSPSPSSGQRQAADRAKAAPQSWVVAQQGCGLGGLPSRPGGEDPSEPQRP